MRPLHARDYAALKTALRGLVDAVGGVEAASSVLGGYSIGRISEAMSLHHPDRTLRLDLVADLEQVAPQALVTAAMARLAGCVLLPLPRRAGSEAEALSGVLRGAGELGGRVADALGDGRISDDERGRLAEQLDALARAVAHAQAVLAGPAVPLRGVRRVA